MKGREKGEGGNEGMNCRSDSYFRCERMLMSSVSVSNCIKFYQTAEDIGAEELRKYCEEIITSHWV